jgi:hypothetical protein
MAAGVQVTVNSGELLAVFATDTMLEKLAFQTMALLQLAAPASTSICDSTTSERARKKLDLPR